MSEEAVRQELDEVGAVEITDAARAAVDALLEIDPDLADMIEHWSIHQRLAAILAELPAIGKAEWNEQQRFHYRSHDDVLNALNPLLAKYGVVIVPHHIRERVPGERETSGGKTMYEVNLCVRYRIYGAAGDWVEAQAWGEGTDMGDKSTNKAMTMAFKNVIAQTFAVSTAESYDTDATSPEQTTRSTGRAPERAVRRSKAQGAPDPGKTLIPNAIEGEGFQGRLRDAMSDIDPTIDWPDLIGQAMAPRFGVWARMDVPDERLPEYWTRLSNAISRLVQEQDLSTFPPLGMRADGEAAILASFTWAFGPFGEPLVLSRVEPPEELADQVAAEAGDYSGPMPETEPKEEIPWVDEVQEALDRAEQHSDDPPADS